MMLFKPPLFLLVFLLLFSIQGMAKENNSKKSKAVAEEFFDSTTLDFQFKGNFKNATVSVAGPNEFHASLFKKNGSPRLDLSELGKLDDGLYKYQITVATNEKRTKRIPLNNGRGKKASTSVNVSESQSGSFRVKDGVIVTNSDLTEGE